MNLLAILIVVPVALYLVAGLIACIAVDIEDLKKKRISAIGTMGDLADFSGWAFLIYLLIWPAWYFAYKKADEEGKQATLISYGEQPAETKKEPIQRTTDNDGAAPRRV